MSTRVTVGTAALFDGSQSVEAVCFDLFHTLVDVGAVPTHVGRGTAEILGVDAGAWNAACFGPLHDICRPTEHRDIVRRLAHSIDPAIPGHVIEAAVSERQRRFDHSLTHVDPGVIGTLRRLRARGMRLALISNASTAEVAAWARSPLAPLFDATIFSCECGSRKPEPAIYHRALEQLGAHPSRCLFVGDGGSEEHVGARSLGLTTVLLTTHIAARLSAEAIAARARHADVVLHGLHELEVLLDEPGGSEWSPASS